MITPNVQAPVVQRSDSTIEPVTGLCDEDIDVLSPVETDAALLANNSQRCWMLHVVACCWESLRKVWNQSTPPNNVGSCCTRVGSWVCKRSRLTMLGAVACLHVALGVLCWSHFIEPLPVLYTKCSRESILSGSTKKNLLVIFAGIVFKLQKSWVNFLSFNPCPLLPAVATDDREQFQT